LRAKAEDACRSKGARFPRYDRPRRALMLVLSRKANQSIMIGSDIRILVVGVDRDQVKLGIEAPRHVPVHRLEVFAEIQRADPAAGSDQ
jgi:carbon storage regulator